MRPSVAMKAKASGTPAKFEATPLKVISVGRSHAGRPPRSDGERQREADQRAEKRRGDADLDAEQIGQRGSTAARAARCWRSVKRAVVILERADQQRRRRHDEEHQREEKERRDAEPRRQMGMRTERADVAAMAVIRPLVMEALDPHPALRAAVARERKTRPALPFAGEGPEASANASTARYFATVAPTTVSHCLAITSLAAACSASVGNSALA